jgi:hypothetical protein
MDIIFIQTPTRKILEEVSLLVLDYNNSKRVELAKKLDEVDPSSESKAENNTPITLDQAKIASEILNEYSELLVLGIGKNTLNQMGLLLSFNGRLDQLPENIVKICTITDGSTIVSMTKPLPELFQRSELLVWNSKGWKCAFSLQ